MVRQAEMFWASSSVYLLKIMKREYEFSKGVRGHFYRKRGELRLPIYLDAKLQGKLEPLAQKKGKDIGEVSINLIRRRAVCYAPAESRSVRAY
jgi:hypothetical protein